MNFGMTVIKVFYFIPNFRVVQFRCSVSAIIYYHRRAVTQLCVNGDRLSKGRMAKFDLAQIQNPSTDRHKI